MTWPVYIDLTYVLDIDMTYVLYIDLTWPLTLSYTSVLYITIIPALYTVITHRLVPCMIVTVPRGLDATPFVYRLYLFNRETRIESKYAIP